MRLLSVLALSLAGAAVMQAGAQTTGDSPGQSSNSVGATNGEQVYREICQACHMANAEGGTGAAAIPALAANAHLADPKLAIDRVLHGKGGMPAFDGMLEPEQIADVINYVRSHFGNAYPERLKASDIR